MKLNLYTLTKDKTQYGLSHIEIAKEVIAGGADVVQLRAKVIPDKMIYESALQIRRLTQENKVLFIVNDRIDILLAVKADGVHLGQDDIPLKTARLIIGNEKIIGISTHSLEQAIKAEGEGADYIAIGPVFNTSSKKTDLEPLSQELIKKIVATINIPIVAIGGISLNNLKELKSIGITNVAVMSAIVDSQNIKKSTALFKLNDECKNKYSVSD
ncbi:MAG: thiamine phosphate synthase [bacterium]